MINKRQYIVLSFFLTRSLFLGGGISLLVNISHNNLIISSFLGMLLGFALLYFFYKKVSLNRYILIIIAISILFINTLSDSVLASTYLLYNTPLIFIILLLFLVFLYGSTKEFKIIARLSELWIFVSLIIFILCYLSLTPHINFNNLWPIFDTSIIDFVKGIIVFCSATLLPNLLLLNYKENLKFKDISIGYIIGSISVLVIMFYILSIYGFEFASITRFPEYSILKKISLFNYISNVENILIMEWIVNIIISGLVCLKILKNHLSNFWLYLICILIICLELFVNTNYIYIIYIKKFTYYIFFIFLLFALFFKSSKKST